MPAITKLQLKYDIQLKKKKKFTPVLRMAQVYYAQNKTAYFLMIHLPWTKSCREKSTVMNQLIGRWIKSAKVHFRNS